MKKLITIVSIFASFVSASIAYSNSLKDGNMYKLNEPVYCRVINYDPSLCIGSPRTCVYIIFDNRDVIPVSENPVVIPVGNQEYLGQTVCD
jgi:hypothetical protein